MANVQIIWDQLDAAAWNDALRTAHHVPLQQSHAYGEIAKLSGNIVHRAEIIADDNRIALAQLVVHKRFGFRLAFWLYAPVWLLHVDARTKAELYRQVRLQCPVPRVIHLLADSHVEPLLNQPPTLGMMANDDTAALLREAGFRRVMTGESRVWWDITDTPEQLENNLDPKWQQGLKKGLNAPVKIHAGGTQAEHYNWLLAAEHAQQHKLGYRQLPLGFVSAYHRLSLEKRPIVTVRAEEKGEKIAGVLFLLHGQTASYHLSWNSERGRELAATNRLLWEAIPRLKKHGITHIDLGMIDDTHAGLARFKLGTGGLPVRACGTFMPRLFGLSKPTLVGLTPAPSGQGV